MGLTLKTTDWADSLWFNYYKSSTTVKPHVKAGKEKQSKFFGFAQDLHYSLYVDTVQKPEGEKWAVDLLNTTTQCDEWKKLKAITKMDRLAAGVATEVIIQHIIKQVPQEEKKQEKISWLPSIPGDGFLGSQASSKATQIQGGGSIPTSIKNAPGDSQKDSGEVRRVIRKAIRKAEKAVEDQKASMEGVKEVLGLSAGNQCVDAVQGADKKFLETYNKLKDNSKLKKVMDLVGRLRRFAENKEDSIVRPAVGQVYGIEQGDDLNRLLPSEVAMLSAKNKVLKYLAVERFLNRQTLQYAMEGKDKSSRGDILVFVDESDSMNIGGRDILAKAVIFAIAITAKKQKRAIQVVGFNRKISYCSVRYESGNLTFDNILDFVNRKPRGGTSFNVAIKRADTLLQKGINSKADVVIITDGKSIISDSCKKIIKDQIKQKGVNWFVLGVGSVFSSDSFKGVISNITHITNTQDLTTGKIVASVINLEGN